MLRLTSNEAVGEFEQWTLGLDPRKASTSIDRWHLGGDADLAALGQKRLQE